MKNKTSMCNVKECFINLNFRIRIEGNYDFIKEKAVLRHPLKSFLQFFDYCNITSNISLNFLRE